ncbi:GNAT family N-acetyltransferase [Vibrio gallicus]|uniref:GNAT family N-acetyltransferase n=1 Tax=Vibrio gallicus TaxID=190897 RepID=UPI0021C446FA|nr:GNAT family N-acetyltransferase [Vibrio gallicus]
MHNLSITEMDPIRLPLLRKVYKQHYPSTKVKAGDKIFIAEHNSQLIGAVRFRHIEQWRLLTGMVVIEKYRGRGVASSMLKALRPTQLDQDVYCFAYTHLTKMYAVHGFVTIDPQQLPGSLKGLYCKYSQSKSLSCMQYHR